MTWSHYAHRAREWALEHWTHRQRTLDDTVADAGPDAEWDWREEFHTGASDDVAFEGGFRLPSYLHGRLFPYQQTGASDGMRMRGVGCVTGSSVALASSADTQASTRGEDGPVPDQKTKGVRWLWELHAQNAGGIIGDEMVRACRRRAHAQWWRAWHITLTALQNA